MVAAFHKGTYIFVILMFLCAKNQSHFSYFSDASETINQNSPPSVSPLPPSTASNNNNNNNNNNNSNIIDNDSGGGGGGGGAIAAGTNLNYRKMRPANKRIGFSNENLMRLHTSTSIDTRLNEFLQRLNIDAQSRSIIFAEDFSYEDFVYHLEKADLLRIGLK